MCIIIKMSLKMKKLLNLIAALGFYACSTDAPQVRPGVNDRDSDLEEEYLDAGAEERADLGEDIVTPKDVDIVTPKDDIGPVVEKPCVTVEGFLYYHGSVNQRLFLSVQPQIMRDYGIIIEEGRLDISYKNFPQHTRAVEAAECARRQGELEFFRYLTCLFENPDEWAHAASSELFRGYAQFLVKNPSYKEELYGRVGLETEAFDRCVNGQETYDVVEAHIAEGYDRGITGTPVIFVNDEQAILGYHSGSFSDLAEIIDNELKKCGEPPSNQNI